MNVTRLPGLFITGTDTDVGKTYVTALIARSLRRQGHRVGVYKPVASGCHEQSGELLSDDAVALWEAAGRPRTLEDVCPQRFAAPLAPHLAARQAGTQVDSKQLRQGARIWHNDCDVLLVEGAGGLMSPISDEDYVADLAADLNFPLLVVALNRIGVINQTLQTLIAAATYCDGIPIAGVLLNEGSPPDETDPSRSQNLDELRMHCTPPVLAVVGWQAQQLTEDIDWMKLASGATDD